MTIDVAFIPSTHTSYDLKRYEGFRKYRFICTYPSIKVGDIITSPDYGEQKLIVTEVFPRDERTTHQGITLKTINIGTLNIHTSQRADLNPTTEMDKRNISITLEQAREWYKSGNATLRKLALAAFTEEELEAYSYEQIMKEISCSTTCSCLAYPVIDEKATKALNKLRSIAFFLNERWHKNTIGTGFFLTPSTQLEYAVEDRKYGWAILKHSSVRYPGVIYFKSKEAAMKALKIAYTEGWLDDLK